MQERRGWLPGIAAYWECGRLCLDFRVAGGHGSRARNSYLREVTNDDLPAVQSIGAGEIALDARGALDRGLSALSREPVPQGAVRGGAIRGFVWDGGCRAGSTAARWGGYLAGVCRILRGLRCGVRCLRAADAAIAAEGDRRGAAPYRA